MKRTMIIIFADSDIENNGVVGTGGGGCCRVGVRIIMKQGINPTVHGNINLYRI
jgi:hypothetical protein